MPYLIRRRLIKAVDSVIESSTLKNLKRVNPFAKSPVFIRLAGNVGFFGRSESNGACVPIPQLQSGHYSGRLAIQLLGVKSSKDNSEVLPMLRVAQVYQLDQTLSIRNRHLPGSDVCLVEEEISDEYDSEDDGRIDCLQRLM